jgi:transposase-like protein
VDKNPAYPATVEALKAAGVTPGRVVLRQCKYLNNVIEQDHRTVKKRVWLAKGNAIGQAHFIAGLFGIIA